MLGLKETEPGSHQGRTWSEAIMDSLPELLDVPGDGEELLFFGAFIIIIVLVAAIVAAFEG